MINKNKNSNYRSEIDGIRAFAVIAVIINHFNKELLPSGYLGVDIFFVISGYVITSSLDIRESRNFKEFIAGFYQRRVKRLVPALAFFVLIISILTSFFVQFPGRYFATATSSMIGASNIYLAFKSTSYWGLDSLMNPFTHTWSLGVEEQFYFIYPFLIWISGFAQKKQNSSKNLFLIVIFLSTASFIYFIYLNLTNPNPAYFLMPTRFWEMAVGVIIFLWTKKNIFSTFHFEKIPPIAIGIAIIATLFLPINYSIISTITIVILTAILIASLREEKTLFNLLRNKYIVYIGLISYSLYLWHWGIIAISRWTIGIYWWTIPFQLILIFIMSVISYQLIEKKFRFINIPEKNYLIILLGIVFSIFVGTFSALLGIFFKETFYLGEKFTQKTPQNLFIDSRYILIGDSHGRDISKLLLKNGTYNLINLSRGGCLFYNPKPKCKKIINFDELSIQLKNRDILIFAFNYDSRILVDKSIDYESLTKMTTFFDQLIPAIKEKGAIAILKLPHPIVNKIDLGSGLVCKKEFFRPILNPKCLSVKPVEKKQFLKKTIDLNNFLKRYSEKHANFYLWDITPIVCSEEICIPVSKNQQFYRDTNHLFTGSPQLSDSIVESLNKLIYKIRNNK